MADALLDDLLRSLPDGSVRDLRVGVFWTAVRVEVEGRERCGLASNLHRAGHCHAGGAGVVDAGRLLERGARELAGLSRSPRLIEASIGVATLNALLPLDRGALVERNAEQVLLRHGTGRRVAVVGNFPFVPNLRAHAGTLTVLEEQPDGDCLPASAASDVLPRAEVVAITGAAFVNHTIDRLLELCPRDARVLVLGPSTPLSPILFERGVDFLSGAVVEDGAAVLAAASQGANFRQIRRRGVRLVTLESSRTADGATGERS